MHRKQLQKYDDDKMKEIDTLKTEQTKQLSLKIHQIKQLNDKFDIQSQQCAKLQAQIDKNETKLSEQSTKTEELEIELKHEQKKNEDNIKEYNEKLAGVKEQTVSDLYIYNT